MDRARVYKNKNVLFIYIGCCLDACLICLVVNMCGIIGYIGNDNGIEVVFNGLIRLEYRGYDSVGIGFKDKKGKIKAVKSVGRIQRSDVAPGMPNLEEKIKENGRFKFDSQIVIGHTRWATHGAPSERNAHPHVSMSGRFAIVHNGIIENYYTLKKELGDKGYKFSSETDSEVIAHLIDYFYNGDFVEAVRKTLTKLDGAYSFLVISEVDDFIIGAKKGSPLCVGIGNDEIIISSDEMPFVDRTKKVIYLNDNELIIAYFNGNYDVKSFEGIDIEKEIKGVPYDIEAITKAGYKHFMLKEIHEQPTTVKNAFISRVDHLDTMVRDNFPNLPRNINRVIYLGCGTSLYAGMVGMYITERYAHVPSRSEYASEFIYRDPVIFRNDVCIALSQSGETADTKEALKIVKDKGAYVAGIVNTVGSQIARLAGKGMYLHAGPEIGVASTKAFTSQIIAINLFNMLLIDDDDYRQSIINEMKRLPNKIKDVFNNEDYIRDIAPMIARYKNFLYLGRDINYPVALEGALKMKEIAYIHAEGYSSGEMKHGPIALVDDNLLSVFIITGGRDIYQKTLNNLLEIKSRNGKVLVITDNVDEMRKYLGNDDYIIKVPNTIPQLTPIINIIPLQLLSYYVADHLGREIDKPRNLAKSVTVE